MADCLVNLGSVKQNVVTKKGTSAVSTIGADIPATVEERIFTGLLWACDDTADKKFGQLIVKDNISGEIISSSDKNKNWAAEKASPQVDDSYFQEVFKNVYSKFENGRGSYFNSTAEPDIQNKAESLKIPKAYNIAQEDENNPNANLPPAPKKEELISTQIGGVPPNIADEKFKKFPKELFYPQTIDKNEYLQDFIEFKVKSYAPRIFSVNDLLKRLPRYTLPKESAIESRRINQIWSTIRLPIQGGISDSNNVAWGGDPMDAVLQASAFMSLSGQTGGAEKITSFFPQLEKLATDPNTNVAIRSYIHAVMANKAISSGSNFFSRAFGAILNPNLELLFQSPELRPFNFRFDLTPRDAREATQVRQIIRVFKQSMAPRVGVADIFLKTPMVYDISYINGEKGKSHESIGKIKTCALKSFNVNYTPNNQYMTYNDNAKTMVAYSIDMQFQELEPIFYDDYLDFNTDEIGY